MIEQILLWGTVAGLIHFVITGALYGNPIVDKIYKLAQENAVGVKKWPSQGKYLITQFLGTQIEVYILSFAFLWLRSSINITGLHGTLALGAVFSGIRVYPRFWNMWIQSTYPNKLLKIEFINGILSTFTIVITLHYLTA